MLSTMSAFIACHFSAQYTADAQIPVNSLKLDMNLLVFMKESFPLKKKKQNKTTFGSVMLISTEGTHHAALVTWVSSPDSHYK